MAQHGGSMLKQVGALLLTAAMCAAAPAMAETKREKAEEMVQDAAKTVSYFASDSAFEPMWELADNAKAMVIIPRSLRGAFMLGASGGNAAMIARNEDGSWSQPTFFTIGSISFGFQAGGEASEMILLVMTQRGMEHLLSSTVKFGGDISIAAGPVGAGAKAQTTDVLAFARSRGLYGGVSLEGAVMKSRGSWNDAYYGAAVSPADIIYKQKAYNPLSATLQNSVWSLANKDHPANLAPVQPVQSQGAPYQQDGATAQPGAYEDDSAWGAPVKDPY
jgi:lipid-binding SYLF domain-containing protein